MNIAPGAVFTWHQIQLLIKFPFKRNGLPCCEDEPGSEKIALK